MIPLPTNLLPYWFYPWNTSSWSGYTPFIFHKELLAVDALRQIFIWKNYAFSHLRMGDWPFWNPHNFAGQPLLANFQSSVFYPLSWPFLLLPAIAAWSIYIFVQPLLAFLCMYLFLKNKLTKPASVFGSLALIFSSYFSTRYFWGVYIHSLLWLPLQLYLIDRYIAKKLAWPKFLALIGVSFSLTILGGYPQHAAFSIIITSLYFLYKVGLKKVQLLVASLAIALLVTSVQLLPTLELYKNSLREGQSSNKAFENGLLEPKYLISILSPDYWGSPATNNYTGGKDYSGMNGYFGLVPLCFALLALTKLRKNKEIQLWTAIGFIGLVLAYRSPLAYLPKILNIPIFSSGNPWNNLFFFQFSSIVLSAFGLDYFFKSKDKTLLGIVASVLLLGIGSLVFAANTPVAIRNTLLVLTPAIVTVAFFRLGKKASAILAIVLVACWGAFYLQKVSPLGLKEYLYPPHPVITFLQKSAGVNRFYGFGAAQFASNFATYFGVYHPDGYDSLWPRWYGELVASGAEGKLSSYVDRADVVIPSLHSASRQKLLNLLGVKYLLDYNSSPVESQDEAKYPISQYRLVKLWGRQTIYENKNALPRAFLVNSYIVAPASKGIETVYKAEIDLQKTVVLEKEINVRRLTSGKAEIINYSPNRVEIETKSPGESLLFLSDTYYPGWKASVDGKQTEILKADYAFRAMLVPKGQNKVLLTYRPTNFNLGVTLSILGLLSIVCLLFFPKTSKTINS